MEGVYILTPVVVAAVVVAAVVVAAAVVVTAAAVESRLIAAVVVVKDASQYLALLSTAAMYLYCCNVLDRCKQHVSCRL